VVSVNGNQVTISPGVYASNWGANAKTFSNGKSPAAWWTSSQVTGDGVEDMTVDHTDSSNGRVGINLINAHGCW
jgi:hypothetical protein